MNRREIDAAGLMSWASIASALGVSERTVRRDYEKALDKLRIALEAAGITFEEFIAHLLMKQANRKRHEADVAFIIASMENEASAEIARAQLE